MPDDKKTIEPIDADFDAVARKLVSPATPFDNKTSALTTVSGQSLAAPKQLKLDLGIEVERVVGGIEMGVLENGIPYLTQRGLAEMSGAARRSIQEITRAPVINEMHPVTSLSKTGASLVGSAP